MKTVRLFQLRQHAKTRLHESRARQIPKSMVLLKRSKCPGEDEFMGALQRRGQGLSFRSSPSRKHEQKLLFCLGEALKDMQTRDIKDALCVSLSQDLQGTLMSFRFAAVTPRLEVVSGLLGFKRTKLGALNEIETTKKVCEIFATARTSAPEGWSGSPKPVDDELLKAVRSKFEALHALKHMFAWQ